MSKRDTFYFPHEYNAKDDPKCERLIWEMGMEGYGMFWTLLEVLRAQPDYTYPVANIPIIARKRTKFQMKFAMRVVSPQKEIIENKAMDPEYCFSLVETLVDELRKRKANIAGKPFESVCYRLLVGLGVERARAGIFSHGFVSVCEIRCKGMRQTIRSMPDPL